MQLEMLQQELQQSQMENELLKEQLMQQEYAADDEQQTTAEESIATEGISVAPSDILQLERQMEKTERLFKICDEQGILFNRPVGQQPEDNSLPRETTFGCRSR